MIQPLSLRHLPEVVRIENACFSSAWSEKQLTQAIENKRYRSFGYFEQDLSGFCIFSTVADEAELLQIAIAPELQRQGLAKKLLKLSIEAIEQQDITRIMLEVRDSNGSALSLYKKAGFILDGKRKGYYPPKEKGGQREDAILMSYICSE